MNKLRVFEAFAGIGAQHAALKRIGINFEIVGISEWFIDAIKCYDAMHCAAKKIKIPSKETQIKYLKQFTFSKDSVHPITDISRLPDKEIENLYVANKRTKNFGSIVDIANGSCKLPDFDLLIYSFPCQDLSTGGLTKGMKKGSGTRSGLLWEIEKILINLKKENRLPKYLLMENVRTLIASSNINDLNEWLNTLEGFGYKNSTPLILNSKDFGVPQDRKRCFIASSLDDGINLCEENLQYDTEWDCRDFIKDNYDIPEFINEANQARLNPTPSRLEMWRINKREQVVRDTIINTITCNMDRSNTAAMFKYPPEGRLGLDFRLLTIREAFLLMGFTENDYINASKCGFSYRKMNKLIGNSIVVNVLEAIFNAMFYYRYRIGGEQ